ncbi:MAG: hypothetical protein EHJ95_07320 [Methanobacteriota archaeon]|nr:MAG: hypothetical protein EHJ95_07320 [Euryarchaeota archaeon]
MNTVSVINTITNTVTSTVNVGNYPADVAVAGNYAYVTNSCSKTVSIINVTTNILQALCQQEGSSLSIRTVYLSFPSIEAVSTFLCKFQ